jgi:hypothetical protein
MVVQIPLKLPVPRLRRSVKMRIGNRLLAARLELHTVVYNGIRLSRRGA